MDQCSNCKQNVSSGRAYKKRKRLLGKSASTARKVLKNELCVLEIGIGLNNVLEADENSFLFDSQRCRYSRLQQELQALKISIISATHSSLLVLVRVLIQVRFHLVKNVNVTTPSCSNALEVNSSVPARARAITMPGEATKA